MKIEVNLDAVKLGESALGEAPERFNAIDVRAAFCKGFALVDSHMLVVADVHQAIITRPAVGADDTLRIDPSTNDGPQGVLGAIFDDLGVNLTLSFKDPEDRLLKGSPTSQPGQRSSANPAGTKVAFINFHHSFEFPALIHSLQGDQQPETLVERVDGLAIELQKSCALRGRKVQTKALRHFFDSIFA
jgi:hypothetical protein